MFYSKKLDHYTSIHHKIKKQPKYYLNMYVLRFGNNICFCATRYCKSFSVKMKPVTLSLFIVNMVVIVQSCSNVHLELKEIQTTVCVSHWPEKF